MRLIYLRRVLFLILILILPPFIKAQCDISSDKGVEDQHYSNAECYNNEAFYKDKNFYPNKVNWAQANYDYVNYNDKRIYSVQGFYDNLPQEQYSRVNYREADLSKLKQEYIDIEKFRQDIVPDKSFNFGTKEKLSCTDCKITFVKNDDGSYSIKTDKGSEATITNYPAGTFFQLWKDGKIVVIYSHYPQNIRVPNTDNVLVIISPGSTISDLPEDLKIYGVLGFNKGQTYIETYNRLTVNGVQIEPYVSIEDITEHSQSISTKKVSVPIFFDGLDHSSEFKDFISLNPNDRVFLSHTQSYAVKLIFSEENPFVNFEKGDKLVIETRLARVEIRSRNQDNLIPLINFRYLHPSDSVIKIDNNDMNLQFKPDDYKQTIHPYLFKNSVPMEIHVFNSDNERIIGTKEEDKKLVISNFNEFAFCGLIEEECYTDLKSEGLPRGAVSTRLKYNSDTTFFGDIKGSVAYGKERGLYVYTSPEGNEIILGSSIADKIILKRIIDNLEELNPNLRKEIGKILVLDREEVIRECGQEIRACARTYDRTLIFNKNSISSIEVFEHEAGHTRTATLQDQVAQMPEQVQKQISQKIKFEGKTYDEWHEELLRLTKEKQHERQKIQELYGTDKINLEQALKMESELTEKYEPLTSLAFNNRNLASKAIESSPEYQDELKKALENLPIIRWRGISGDAYGKDLGPKDYAGNVQGQGKLSSTWADGTTGPGNGCVNAYGCNNEHEDRSTWVDSVRTKPASFFAPLLDSLSPQYDSRYQQKLNELYISGDISQEDYNRIILNLPRERLIPVKRLTKDGRLVPIYEVVDKDSKDHRH